MTDHAAIPTVSVIVPCLNRAAFLVPTLESILAQDYPQIQCIVIDGGSTDETLAILRSYQGRIQWVSERDHGHADAINKGWRMSTGEIVAWLNADDVWVLPNAVSQAVAYFETHPDTDVLYGECGAIDAAGNVVGLSYWRDWDLEYAVEHCDHCIPQPAAFLRRSIVEKVGWLDTAFYQKKDHELWLRIALQGTIKHVPVMLARERTIKGLSYDGKSAAPACLQVTHKFYTLHNIPASLMVKRQRALSNSYLQGMWYAYAGGRLWRIIIAYAFLAVVADPSNAARALDSLAGYGRRFGSECLPHWMFAALRKIKRAVWLAR